jgi:hypothetical protein
MSDTEWHHHGKPPLNRRAEVWAYGQVRTGKFGEEGFYFALDDCTNPNQNRALSMDEIKAWRLVE